MPPDPLAEDLELLAELARQAAHCHRHYGDAPFACSTRYAQVVKGLLPLLARVSAGLAGERADLHPEAVYGVEV